MYLQKLKIKFYQLKISVPPEQVIIIYTAIIKTVIETQLIKYRVISLDLNQPSLNDSKCLSIISHLLNITSN